MQGKLDEILTERGNYDARKEINRSNIEIPQSALDEIETQGITSERLDTLQVPVFKYKTQITLHGHFGELSQAGRIGQYKHLVRNGNESLGIRYAAIDYAKKENIYTRLRACGFEINHNSSEWFAYRMGKVCGNKSELLAEVESFKADQDKIDKSLFTGNVRIALYAIPWLGYYAALIIEIQSAPQGNIDAIIENITGRTVADIDAEIQAKQAADEIERAQWQANYDKEQAENKKIRESELSKIRAEIANHPELELIAAPNEPGYYIKVGFEFGDTPKFFVRNVFKYGKTLRVKSRVFDSLGDALECLKVRGIENTKGSKELLKQVNVYRLKDTPVKQDTRTVAKVSALTVRRNQEKNGIEIVFPAKPEKTVLDALKQNGFRWSQGQGLWWIKYSDTAMQFANNLA